MWLELTVRMGLKNSSDLKNKRKLERVKKKYFLKIQNFFIYLERTVHLDLKINIICSIDEIDGRFSLTAKNENDLTDPSNFIGPK